MNKSDRINGAQTITFTCENAIIDQDLIYQLAYGQKACICKYFLRYPFGLFALRKLSERELLFIMPNNVKRRLRLPMTRVARRGLKSRKYKQAYRALLLLGGTVDYRRAVRYGETTEE